MSPLSSSKEKEAMNEKARIKLEDEKEYGGTGRHLSFDDAIENGLPTPDKHASLQNGETISESHHLLKTRDSFWEDARSFHEGTIPQSVVLAVVVGIVCGTFAFVYYYALELLLELIWKTLPEKYVEDTWPEWAHVLWIPLVGLILCLGVGVSVVFLGDPGDLPYTIKCVHDKGYLEMSHVLPMVVASQFSILGGGSLGPEAPLVAVCAALGGFISRRIFKQTNRNVVRKHTLMGMAGALAAFFGCPLGGSLFALEVNGRFGVEYFEHIVESILCGEVCLIVFRSLARLPIEPIWTITLPKLAYTTPIEVLTGCALGLAGAAIAYCFALMHWRVMDVFSKFDLLRDERAVYRGLVGGAVILGLAVMIPHTLFWGENEIQTIGSLRPASTLPHVWPTSGAFGFEMDSMLTCFIVGLAKLVAISFTVAGGYRGGYIFPFFAAGCAFGRGIFFLFPAIPVQLCTLCMAASINVAITRTSIATTLILAYLSGEPNAISAILASSLVSLFATAYMYSSCLIRHHHTHNDALAQQPFIKSQISRNDLELSLMTKTRKDIDVSGLS